MTLLAKFRRLALVSCSLAIAAGAPSARGQDAPQEASAPGLVIVFDVSSSMWENMPYFGRPGDDRSRRHAVAKDFARKMIDRLASQFPTHSAQLYLFGSHRRGACDDRGPVGSFRPLADQAHRADILDRIMATRPTGRTPLADSLEDAAELLRGTEAAAIVLITDGVEECKSETAPCESAARIKQTNPRLIAHVVGVALPSQVVQRVGCVAETTGGRMIVIDRPADLEQAVNLIADSTPQAVSARVSIKWSMGPTVTFAEHKPVPTIRLIDKGAQRQIDSRKGAFDIVLKPGTYRLEYQMGALVRTRDFDIDQRAAPFDVTQSFAPGTLSARLALPGGREFEAEPDVIWRIEMVELADGRLPNPTPVTEYESPGLNIALPPGRYRISANYQERDWPSIAVTIAPDDIAEVLVPVR